MPPFDRLREAAKKVPWGAFAHVVAENLHARTDAATQVIDQLKEWGTHLTANALLKWTVVAATATPCGSPDVSSGRAKRCGHYAVGHCDVCGRPCCLAHARVDYSGDMICAICIGASKVAAGIPGAGPGAGWQQPPPAPKKKKRSERAEALRSLRLADDATWPEIKKRYRKLVVRHNADRPQSTDERAANTEKLKKINAAYETLRQMHEAEAA